MGLTVTVHPLAHELASDFQSGYLDNLRNNLRTINEVLADRGLPRHDEPTVLGAAAPRDRLFGCVPTSFMHCLYRAYARYQQGLPLTPVAEGELPGKDPALDDINIMLDCHLVLFWQSGGYYVPIEFRQIICPEDESSLPGGFLGSSVMLLDQLTEIAEPLDITLSDGNLSEAEIAEIIDEDESHPLYRERLAWVLLYEAARVSVANSTVISFD